MDTTMLRGIVLNGKLRGDLNSSVPVIITAFPSAQFSSTVPFVTLLFCVSLKKGSLFIICFIFSSPRNSRWSIFHQLMFGISFFDILASVGFILGTLPVPEDTGIYGASGNAATCKLQGMSRRMTAIDNEKRKSKWIIYSHSHRVFACM
jgi:hypothetical protein